jgi:very-short-patch-repair endonuclease
MNIIPFEKSFASHEKSKYWSDKNGNINPINVTLKSNKKYWFNCNKCNHIFDIALNNVSAGKWCPFCGVNKLCEIETCNTCFEKSFASHDKAKYWSSKNNKNPRLVTKKSDSEKFWFNCDKCIHSFDSTLYNVYKGNWCPYCSVPTKRLCENDLCKMCFNQSFASHEKAKYWSSKNGNINPRNVFLGSNQKYWFDCSNCSHCFEIKITGINRGNWCSYCCYPPQKLCIDLNCENCFNNSFASHEKSQYWSSKNGDTTPRDVFNSTHEKYWFDCNVCGHLFESILSDITKNGSWCGYCVHSKLCSDLNCNDCFNNSFASHEKSQYWSSKNGDTNPLDVFKLSNKKYWFDCNICSHSFYSSLSHISSKCNTTWCPYCSNPPKIMCEDLNCKNCFNKSFASHEKVIYWSNENGDTNPRLVFKSTRNKYLFKCNNAHLFKVSLYNIVAGKWCPYCVNKTEAKLYEKIQPLYPTIITQFKQEWCKKLKHLPFDFVIPEYKIIIELDGPQHFQQISNWSSPEEQFENDKYKEKCANDNGYSVIRLLQEDVFYDTYDWVKELYETIEEIKNGDEIANVYLCKNGEYDAF